MPPGETDEFTLNGSKCSINVQEDYLEIKIPQKDAKIPRDGLDIANRTIPFFEMLSAAYVESDESLEKRKQSLSITNKTKLPHVAIRTIKRSKDHRWRLTTVKLKSASSELCQKWAEILNQKIETFALSRPKCLLVFVNPFGGTGSAKSIYDKKVIPIFDEAKIKTEVITTDSRHHAKEYVETNDLSSFDGIIAVGGDGMLNEVINGLIFRTQSDNGINVDAKIWRPRYSPKYQRPSLRVGIIPAGSTDCICYVTQGINDAETAALHVVLGDSHPVDVVSLHNAQGLLQQFSMSLTGYGYFGDMLRRSENFRWMGPPRYTFVGANVFLKNKSYSGEVHYLPADSDDDPKNSSFCRTPCSVCKDGLIDSQPTLFTPSVTPNNSFNFSLDNTYESDTTGSSPQNHPDVEGVEKLHENGTESSLVASVSNSTEELDSDEKEEGLQFAASQGLEEASEERHVDSVIDTSTAVMLNSEQATSEMGSPSRPNTLRFSLQDDDPERDLEEWKVIKGDFMSVNGVAMSCACERSPLGLSPYSHLSDGAIDLIVVRSCSRFEFLRYMIAHTGKGNRFDFPYVEVHRVKAFQFIPSSSDPVAPALHDSATVSSPSSVTTDTSANDSIHLSLEELRVKYNRNSEKNNKKKKKLTRKMKRSQSVSASNPNSVSSWNSDGEIITDPNMTVRVHRGLILMFCRGVEDIKS